MTPSLGDITLDGKPYRIDLQSYRCRDVVDFSPRASTPGGSVIHSDLMLYQPLMQTDWQHGFGFPWYEDAMGYLTTEGNVDTRHNGIVSLFTSATLSDSNDSNKINGITHKNNFYTWGSSGVRRYTGTAWEDVKFLTPVPSVDVVTASSTGNDTVSVAMTVPKEGTNPALLVFVGTKSNIAVSSVVFGGVPLTQASTVGTAPKLDLWYLLDPVVDESLLLEVTTASNVRFSVIAIPVAYVDSITPLGTVATETGNDAAPETPAVSAVGELVIDGIVALDGVSVAKGSLQTKLGDEIIPSELSTGASTQPGQSTTNMAWTLGSAKDWAHIAVSIKPPTSTGAVNTVFSNDEYLFIVPTAGRIRRSTYSSSLISQPGKGETQDTYINESAPGTSYQTKPKLKVGTDADSKHRSILIKFKELELLPTTVKVLSARLKLYVKEKSTTAPTIAVHRILQPAWKKKATWNKYDGETVWNTAGCNGANIDYYDTTAMYSALPATLVDQFMYIDLDPTEVEAMITSNNGMIIKEGATGANKYWEFASSRETNSDWRPCLEITYESDGEWEDAGVNESARDYAWIHVHNGKIYAGERETNLVHYSTTADLSDLEGTDADIEAIVVGIGEVPVLGAITFAGFLYLARSDGLWSVGDDNIARKVLDYSNVASDTNFRGMAVHNGYLVFPIQNSLFQWNGSRVSEITPGRLNDEFPYLAYGRFANLLAAQSYLYCSARTNETTYTESILCFDGVGWHKLCDPIVDGEGSISMLEYDPINNYLWYHIDSDPQGTYYIPLQSTSLYPYANFPTTGTHSWISSRWDMGFRRITKSSPSILIEGRNLLNQQVYMEVFYSLDGGEWIPWGQVIRDGYTELTFPGGLKTQEYNYIQLRVDLHTTDATQTPILEGVTLRFLMRPDVAWGWNINLPVADNLVYGNYENSFTAQELWNGLQDARRSKSPVKFIDLDGNEYFVYITAMTSQAIERHGDVENADSPSIERLININIIEVK